MGVVIVRGLEANANSISGKNNQPNETPYLPIAAAAASGILVGSAIVATRFVRRRLVRKLYNQKLCAERREFTRHSSAVTRTGGIDRVLAQKEFRVLGRIAAQNLEI